MRRLLILTGAAVASALLLPAPIATAADAGPSGSANYVCSMTPGGSADVSVTMSLDNAPASVMPGQTLRLAGTLTFGFTAQTAAGVQLLLATKMGVSSADFALDASSASHTDAISAKSVQGEQTSTGKLLKPFTLSAKVVLPAYKVPTSATGDVVISLPAKAKLDNDVAKAPAKVAFTAVLSETGLIHERKLACALGDSDTTPLITRIPVDAPTHAGATSPTGPASGPADLGLPAPASDPGLESAPASPQASPAQTETQSQTRPVFEAIPPTTRHSGVFIPAWSIVLLVLMFPLGAVSYALSLRYRLRVMKLAAGTTSTRSES